ncbi:hypothetical protein [Amycolatopsis taiwanensis]|uniref:Phytase-like domain-containing protein n=1 Tax=Amycolatopsis taiwanensis TaxID=342230 RepID=A0A9W6R4S0_9PSEU|nr:hypothetical protein [Amycolatopsis taiwanensis]GLY68593.1 hypothetical protein Atai01_52120 [Amycolatopsis taiwanensis]
MRTNRNRLAAAVLTLAAVALSTGTASAAPGGSTGPSSSDAPYLVRHTSGITFTSVLTTGDSVGGYRMAGIPDGLGAYDNGDGTFTLLMNHEIAKNAGVPRAHGGAGAFVSKWVIDKQTLKVKSGSDLIQKVFLSDGGRFTETPGAVFDRFCSADLPSVSAFYNAATGKGYNGHIFTNGEETSGGRAFAHVVDSGESYQLADLGTASFENVVANPGTGDKTVVSGTSDTGGGAVYIYVGDKKSTGNPVEKAGLTGGTRYSISVPALPQEDGAKPVPAGPLPFTLDAAGATKWDRPEDAAWDPNNPNDLYFTTTASMDKHSRLWRARFDDITDPAKGGTVEMLVEGPAGGQDGPRMMDNITVNDRGQVLIQEDPGGNSYLAGLYQYDISSGAIRRIADHDPERFLPGGPVFDTIDEESSGIIPAPFLGAGKYLLDVQNHTKLADKELVEKGQLLVLNVPPGQPLR